MLLTWKSIHMVPEDSWFTRRPGSVASWTADFTQQNSDPIIVVGPLLDMPQIAFSQKNSSRSVKEAFVDVDLAPRPPHNLFREEIIVPPLED